MMMMGLWLAFGVSVYYTMVRSDRRILKSERKIELHQHRGVDGEWDRDSKDRREPRRPAAPGARAPRALSVERQERAVRDGRAAAAAAAREDRRAAAPREDRAAAAPAAKVAGDRGDERDVARGAAGRRRAAQRVADEAPRVGVRDRDDAARRVARVPVRERTPPRAARRPHPRPRNSPPRRPRAAPRPAAAREDTPRAARQSPRPPTPPTAAGASPPLPPPPPRRRTARGRSSSTPPTAEPLALQFKLGGNLTILIEVATRCTAVARRATGTAAHTDRGRGAVARWVCCRRAPRRRLHRP